MMEVVAAAAPSGDDGGNGGKKKRSRGMRKHFRDQHISLALSSYLNNTNAAKDAGGSSNLPEGVFVDKDETYSCKPCHRKKLLTLEAVNSHCSGVRHHTLLLLRKQAKKPVVVKNDDTAQQRPSRLRIENDGADATFDEKKQEHTMSVRLKAVRTITFTVTNVSANTVFRFKDWNGTTESKEFCFLNPAPEGHILQPNMQLKLKMQMSPQNEFVHAFKVFITMDDLSRGITVVESCNVKISFVTGTTEELSSSGVPYKAQKKRTPKRQYYRRGDAVQGVPLPGLGERDELEKDRPLPWFDMPRHVHQFINDGLVFEKSQFSAVETEKLSAYKQALDEDEVTFNNYQPRFTALLYLEEHQTDVDLESYFIERTQLQKHGNSRLLSLEVPGLAENRPSVLRGDQLFVRICLGPDQYDRKEYQGFVHDVQQTRVFLGFNKQLIEKFHQGMEFSVRFVNNRLPMRIEHRALSLLEPEESNLENVLFPTEDTARTHGLLLPSDTPFQFYARAPELNLEQERAVRHIVLGTSRPAPYIVFGPPGTGKTFTIVEAIKQVLKNFPSAHVLACAPSNSAADLIAEKLIVHLQKRQVYRLNAFSRLCNSVPVKIRDICNLTDNDDVCFPSKKELVDKGVRVFVTTLTTAGRLVSADFDHDFFSHVFVDEASQATEPETLTALAGLLYMNDTTTNKQIVLAGDPQQLGPILRSPFAKKYKLDMSLMERLMERTLYHRRDAPGPQDNMYYDPLMITKLVRNYRSHPAILDVPNHLFYNGELVACGRPEMTHLMCGWDNLADDKQKPVIFHATIGEDMQEANSPSFFNPFEVTQVMKYVDILVNQKSPRGIKITEDHIGIISPYSKQVQKIRGELRKRRLEKLKVGSVEEFQGQERLIIIVSTVRSNPRFLTTDSKFGIGFLQNNKRFNVAVTRAKALLIVIGNPNILRYNDSWNRFVEYCKGNGCMIGSHLDSGEDDESFKKLVELLQMIDMNDGVPGDADITEDDLAEISAFNNEQVSRRDL